MFKSIKCIVCLSSLDLYGYETIGFLCTPISTVRIREIEWKKIEQSFHSKFGGLEVLPSPRELRRWLRANKMSDVLKHAFVQKGYESYEQPPNFSSFGGVEQGP